MDDVLSTDRLSGRATNTYGFIGLGHQGSPMAARMISAGLRPWLWARRREVLDRYVVTDAHIATSPAELGARCDVVGLCLYDADAIDTVLYGDDGLMTEIRPGTVLAVHATVGSRYLTALAERVAERDVHLVDAPVSGGDEAALAGQLLVIFGGDDVLHQGCQPMFDTYASRVIDVGPLGSAQTAKLINNSLMTAITGLVFEAFEVGQNLDIDRDGLADVLANGSAANPAVGVYRAFGAETFAIRAWPTLHKDVALAAREFDDLPGSAALLMESATATIAEMERLREHYERVRVHDRFDPNETL